MTDITVTINERWLRKDEWEIEHKLAHLILESVIHCNDGWWYKEEGIPWKEGSITHHVSCNDIFAWGCADGEDIGFSEICDLYELWRVNPTWGAAIWCIKKRKQRPQAPIEKRLVEAGYNINELLGV